MTRTLRRMMRIGFLTATVAPLVRSMNPKCVVICAALVLAACESSVLRLPTAPSTSSGSALPPAPPASRTHTLSGVVTAGGRPAAGVRVAVLELEPEPTTTTDEQGHYSISGLETSSIWGRTLVRFSQPGYFTEFKRPNIAADMQLDIALEPLVFITLGDMVRGTVTRGDAICAGKDYEEDACQRFAVVAQVSGTLAVTLTSREGAALDVVNPDGLAFAEFSGSVKRLSIPATAGATYEIRVVTDRFARAEFELMASLR